MSGAQNWREETGAGDYFLHQQKQINLADRRPVIRKGSDLVGPGIGAGAVRITDYNDLLATFNGYYSSAPGASGAPNATEAFIGYVVSDAQLGGKQVFTGLTSGVEYSRFFNRSPTDPEALGWTNWTGQRVPATARTLGEVDFSVPTNQVTVLPPPALTLHGDASVYDRSDAGIRITEQGIYTGHIQVGDRVGSTVADLYFYRPVGNVTSYTGQLGVPLGPTANIPFTVVALDGLQGFSLTVVQQSGANRDLWWRFECTRVGDAV